MSEATKPLAAKPEEGTCCFWIQRSEACANIKIAVVSIVAAVALTAIAAGILLVLAQHGYPLAGINAIAQLIEAKWLYLGLAVAGAVAILDAVIIIAMVRSSLNRTYTQRELKRYKIDEKVRTTGDLSKMPRNSYWKYDVEAKTATEHKEGRPQMYVLVVKEGDGKHTPITGFKTEEDRALYIQQLGDGYCDGAEATKSNPEYEEGYIAEKFQARYTSDIMALRYFEPNQFLRDGHFKYQVIDIPGTSEKVYVLAAKESSKGVPTLHLFKEEKAKTEALEGVIKDLSMRLRYKLRLALLLIKMSALSCRTMNTGHLRPLLEAFLCMPLLSNEKITPISIPLTILSWRIEMRA